MLLESIASWLDPLIEMPEKEAHGGDGLECNPRRAYLKWNYRKYLKQMLDTEIRTQGKKRKLDFREEVRDYEESMGEGRRSLKQTRIVSTEESRSLEGRSVMRLGFLLPAGRVLLAKLDAGLLQFNKKRSCSSSCVPCTRP